MSEDWHNASRREPCPVCGHDSWCSISNNGEVCVCRRTPSPYPAKSGIGWIHRLREVKKSALQLQTSTLPPVDVDAYFKALPRGNEQVRLSRYLMRELSIPSDLFLGLDVRWDRKAKAAAFPMRNVNGLVTGIRYRQLETGRKWSFKGGHDGLFFANDYLSALPKEMIVCEGPTDMLAAAATGLMNVIGRSSCMTGLSHLKEMARFLKAETVTIVADADEPKTRPDGTTFRPGIDGARKLAKDLGLTHRIMFPAPTFKDIRDWYAKGGMTGDDFRAVAAGAKWCVPEIGE